MCVFHGRKFFSSVAKPPSDYCQGRVGASIDSGLIEGKCNITSASILNHKVYAFLASVAVRPPRVPARAKSFPLRNLTHFCRRAHLVDIQKQSLICNQMQCWPPSTGFKLDLNKSHLEVLALDIAAAQAAEGLLGNPLIQRHVGDEFKYADLADLFLAQADIAGQRTQ